MRTVSTNLRFATQQCTPAQILPRKRIFSFLTGALSELMSHVTWMYLPFKADYETPPQSQSDEQLLHRLSIFREWPTLRSSSAPDSTSHQTPTSGDTLLTRRVLTKCRGHTQDTCVCCFLRGESFSRSRAFHKTRRLSRSVFRGIHESVKNFWLAQGQFMDTVPCVPPSAHFPETPATSSVQGFHRAAPF